jgi:protein required for attachment to host cells
VADPHFLGELRKRLDSATAATVAGTVSSNVTREDIEHITRAADSVFE